MAPALVSGSAWYPDRTWNSWKSKETWIPDKRYQEKDVDIERQKAKSWEKWPSEANCDNDNEIELDLVSGEDQLSVEHNDQYKIGHYDNEIELDLVSGKDQLSAEHNDQYKIGHYDNEIELDLVSGEDQLSVEHNDQDEIGQWTAWLQKWEDEKPWQLKELTLSAEHNDQYKIGHYDNESELDLVSGEDQLSVEHNDQYKIGHYDNEFELDLVSGEDQLSVEHNDQYKIGHYDYNEIELDLVSGEDQLSVEHNDQDKIGQWTAWLQKWEDEKPGQLKELTSSETCFCENNDDDEFEAVPVEDEEDHEWVIRNSLEILQRYRGEAKATVHKSGKPLSRRARARAKARRAKMDDRKGSEHSKVEVGQLRYSQESCSETFQCGRTISTLVEDLLKKKVTLSDPFLRLNVFETKDRKTQRRVLRCIDNRRLYALKEYAKRSGKDRVMVNVNFFNLNTLEQVQRFIQNSDDTDGRHVRLRKNGKGNKRNRAWILD